MTTNQQAGPVRVERQGAVAVVTLDVPGRRNAFSHALRLALLAALQRLMDDEDEVRAIVLTGADGHFCAGGDLSEMTAAPALLPLRERIAVATRIVRLMVAGAKPVIGAVEGSCIGAGVSLVAACDMAYGASDSRYECSFVKIGLMPDTGALWTLPQKVGAGRARRMMLLPSRIDGNEAARIGLLTGVTAPGGALAAALEQAQRLAALPPATLLLLKGALATGGDDLATAMRHESDINPLVRTTADHKEAVAAFLDKRKPQFRGE